MDYKTIILAGGNYYSWDETGGWLVINEPVEAQDYLDYGFNAELLNDIPEEYWNSFEDVKVLFYTNDPDVEEITIETEVEEFTIYDEFGDSMEVLYYTDDKNKEEAELHIEANYSPLDELEGDFEIITWIDDENADLNLQLKGLPSAQFIYQSSPYDIYGFFRGYILQQEQIQGGKGELRFLFSSEKIEWKTWRSNSFETINTDNHKDIVKDGLTFEEVLEITQDEWEQWEEDKVHIGVFLDADIKGDEKILTDKISVVGLSPTETTKINEARLYILNTVSTINVTFENKTLLAEIDDADEGKVQYRVILNGEQYYPKGNDFTELLPSPLNVGVDFTNQDIKIGEINTLRLEFQDYWGSTDHWETSFLGEYNGLLFMDENGEHYSTDLGEVLKYLDFGAIIAGQTTLEKKIVLKNTYGVPVKNLRIRAVESDLPNGVKIEFGTNETTFEGLEEISFPSRLENKEEFTFYTRMVTKLGMTPVANGVFDIAITADKDT